MPKQRTVEVTEEHIKNTSPSGWYCAIALALKDDLGWKDPLVSYKEISNKEETFKPSEELGDWIYTIDRGGEVFPITLCLDTETKQAYIEE